MTIGSAMHRIHLFAPKSTDAGGETFRLCGEPAEVFVQLPLVGASRSLLPVRVAYIYQQFSAPAEGVVRNFIMLSVWPWLQVLPAEARSALVPL